MTTNRMGLTPTDDQIKTLITNLAMSAIAAQQTQSFTQSFAVQNELQIAALRELLERRSIETNYHNLPAMENRAEQAECVAMFLDDKGIPRELNHEPLSLVGRIMEYRKAVTVPDEMTPEMMRAVQLNTELGVYATANLSGAYRLFSEFWKVAISSALQREEK